jgi:steroid 5-alpha reductase family enzyme
MPYLNTMKKQHPSAPKQFFKVHHMQHMQADALFLALPLALVAIAEANFKNSEIIPERR